MDHVGEDIPKLQEPYGERYQNLGIANFRALKRLIADVRAGRITEENEDEIIALFAESSTEAQREIDVSAFDPLLEKQGFYTRKHFLGHVDNALWNLSRNPKSRREGGKFQGMAILLGDLDYFKLANDTYGHLFGDRVLQRVGEIMKKNIRRKEDILGHPRSFGETSPEEDTDRDKTGRIGGEELAALLFDTDLEGAVEIAGRIRNQLLENPIKTPDGRDWQQTISFGICFLEPNTPIATIEALKRADTALYQSKDNGRNRVTVWEPDMQNPSK